MIEARRRRLRRLAVALAITVALLDERVGAASRREPVASRVVVVSPPNCPEGSFQLAPFLDSLRVELAGPGLRCCTLAEPNPATPTDISLHVHIEPIGACETEPERVRITVQQPGELPPVLEREISLSDVAQAARARALALAVAELIRSLGEETLHASKPVVSVPKKTNPAPNAPVLPPISSVAFSLHIDAEVRNFPKRDTTLWGGRVRLAGHRHAFHATLDLGANYSNAHNELGELSLRSASTGFGLGPHIALPATIIEIGPRAELGWAWIRGATTLANVATASGSGLIASIGFRVTLEAPANMRIKPCITLETGGVLRGINGNANGQVATGVGGYYFLAALGIALTR